MGSRRHTYRVRTQWVGDANADATAFRRHDRAYRLSATGKPDIPGSSDPAFRGDAGCWNPEDLLVASLVSCHQLWYLGLCAAADIIVLSYEDEAEGVMIEERVDGAGQFESVVLRPRVVLARGGDVAKAGALHETAHAHCFVARSVNFPVLIEPTVTAAGSAVGHHS